MLDDDVTFLVKITYICFPPLLLSFYLFFYLFHSFSLTFSYTHTHTDVCQVGLDKSVLRIRFIYFDQIRKDRLSE